MNHQFSFCDVQFKLYKMLPKIEVCVDMRIKVIPSSLEYHVTNHEWKPTENLDQMFTKLTRLMIDKIRYKII